MLPLWIIDLTDSSDRRDRFLELLGQTNHVFPKPGMNPTDDDFCWYYTHYDDAQAKIGFDLSECSEEETKKTGHWVYDFQSRLVKDGGTFVKMIRHSTQHAYTTLNVCVLGDASETFTQLVFPSVALLLQKEKGRMLANHVHQGMSVIGALFVPSSINSRDVKTREELLRTLMEVDVQYRVPTVRGYDHVLLYQDVQNRVDKYYPLLDSNGQAEYLYQCLLHLYYACNTQHPLISGVAAADNFYLALGVSSVFFDEGNQDKETSCTVANRLLEQFYAEPTYDDVTYMSSERRTKEKKLFIPESSVSIDRILSSFIPDRIDLEKDLTPPYPDPLSNFAHKQLKRCYFKEYAVNRLANFRRQMNDEIEKQTRSILERVHAIFNRNLDTLQNVVFPSGVRHFVEHCNKEDGGIKWMETLLKNLQDLVGENKKRIQDNVNTIVWKNVFQIVDKKYLDAFMDYHDAYIQDISTKPSGHFADEKKAAAIDNLCNHLKQETPILSRVVRAFLLGIVSVLVLLPVLNFVSPLFINLGNIRHQAFIWAVVAFMIPAFCEIFSAVRYIVKRERKERRLKAFYLHDGYARIANRIITEANQFYDNINQLCDLYRQRSDSIRAEVNDVLEPEEMRFELPVTPFNQPVIEGSFNDHPLLKTEDLEPKKIYINHVQKQVDRLFPDDYFSLIHLFKDNFISLFDGVRIPERHPVEKEKGTGVVRLISPEEMKTRQTQEWNGIRDKFIKDLPLLVEEELVPLHNPSVAGMLQQYYKKTRRAAILWPFIQYAAPNGEFITSADKEEVDVKTQDEKTREMLSYYLPDNMNYQTEQGGEDPESQQAASLFKRYLFLTRWSSFDTLALNRILPTEDFDIEEKKRQVNEEERDGKKNGSKINNGKDGGAAPGSPVYPIATSSTILWSLCEGDNSILWPRLFHTDVLVDARKKSNLIKTILTQKD